MLCKLNEEICQLRENTENEICALGKMSRTEYEELCREHNEELKNLRESTAEAVKALRQEVERDLSISLKEVSEVSEEIKGLRESYAVSLSNQTEAESNYLESLKELREEHEESELSVRKQFALYENKLSELNLNYSRNLDLGILAAKREIEKLLSYGKESLSESVQEANEELKELLANNKSDYDLILTLYGNLENELKEDFTRESLERFASLRTEFESLLIRGENKLEEVEKYYSKELSRMFDERSEQLKGLETRFSVLGVKLESKDEEFGRSCDLLNEELRRYAGELDSIRGSLNELGSQVGPEVLEKIRESEKSLELRLSEMGERCEEFLREIEQNFTEERSEELSEYSRNIQALKAEMSEAGELLKVRLSDEISEARREARVEFGREVEKKLSEYENDLCNRYEELTEKLHKELSGYRIKLSELESYSESKIKEVTEYYDEQTGSQYRKFSEKLQDYSSRFMSLETRISQLSNVVEKELESQRDKIKTYGEELSERYEEKSLELSKEFEELSIEVNVVLHELESGVCEQSEALKDLSAGYVKLRDELEHSREALSDYRREMSESGEELRKEYAVQYEEYNAEVESRLSKLNEEIGERVEDSLSDVIAELSLKIEEKISGLREERGEIDSKVWESLSLYDEKLKELAEETEKAERRYEIRLDEYAQKLLSEQASLEEVSSEHMEQLISRYEKISEELSNYKIEMYSEIDERTRRGLSQLSSGLEEKLSELSIKENEYSELLKEESRSYTELLEEVYKSNVEEHRAFELKIRENVAEVEKSISKIRSVGESESNRLLSEYTRIHEKVCELSSDLEAKKSTLEKSLEESLSLYVSKLGVKYSEIENQMSMLEESFGECIKAQSHVALKELTSGRETLLSIRQEMEALKTSGEEERGNLHNKYLEIEKSLLELKGNYEKRLSEVVEEAGEAACEELSKQLAELSERYEISRKESEILYGELSGEIESSGKLLSSLKEELNVLSENSKLLQN